MLIFSFRSGISHFYNKPRHLSMKTYIFDKRSLLLFRWSLFLILFQLSRHIKSSHWCFWSKLQTVRFSLNHINFTSLSSFRYATTIILNINVLHLTPVPLNSVEIKMPIQSQKQTTENRLKLIFFFRPRVHPTRNSQIVIF